MKINLYYPPLSSQRLKGSQESINTERNYNPKAALVALASSFRMMAEKSNIDYELQIIDMQIGQHNEYYKSFDYGPHEIDCYRSGSSFFEYIDAIKEADIHAISSNFTINAHSAVDLAKYIKHHNPNGIVIFGGTDVTTRPSFYLDNGGDIIVRGEGEVPFYKCINAIYHNQPVDDIPNVYTLSNRHQQQGIDYSQCLDINTLPPPALDLTGDLFIYNDTGEDPPPNGVRLPYVCFETSRGCYHRCPFCTTPITKGKYRSMTPDTVERHFRYFKSLGIKTILFEEDNILSRLKPNKRGEKINESGREDVIEIFNQAHHYGFAWEFANGVEIGKLFNNGTPDIELIETLFWNEKESNIHCGCYRVQIPIESFNDEIRFAKLIPFAQQLEVYKLLLEIGVQYQTYNFLIGYPDDTPETLNHYVTQCELLKKTLYKIYSSYTPYFNVFNLILLPGTHYYNSHRNLLHFDVNTHPEVFGFNLSAVDTLNQNLVQVYDKTFQNLIEAYETYCIC